MLHCKLVEDYIILNIEELFAYGQDVQALGGVWAAVAVAGGVRIYFTGSAGCSSLSFRATAHSDSGQFPSFAGCARAPHRDWGVQAYHLPLSVTDQRLESSREKFKRAVGTTTFCLDKPGSCCAGPLSIRPECNAFDGG